MYKYILELQIKYDSTNVPHMHYFFSSLPTIYTRPTLNAETPSATQMSVRAEGWDCETVGAIKQSR